ncbi:phosphoadenosine phosphosulfate reductase family protein [Herbaspirillum aquaticum]|uniref:phosphoadenosine phosphosulfate reductase domain-containing protein n=1 Tax=Herbaspirillum aquaticum TaxID=568783 RepID=UPI0024DEDC39|nr:phosphoadenosine phosphosulfate reductase family protein [Herbaspirillum aquaticum]
MNAEQIKFVSPKFLAGAPAGKPNEVCLTPEVDQMLATESVVAISVSGGKDSEAVALAVARHLERVGHNGPKVLIHADLGRIEWRQSLPKCQQLAEHLGWELMIVRRTAGDMMDRWESRWRNCVERYEQLACVKVILPWSTPALRFCTSEAKQSVISRELRKRFPTQAIVNVTGVRAEESRNRSKMPVSAPNTLLKRKNAEAITWNAILNWPVQDVVYTIHEEGLQLHEAYTQYGMTRVSCSFCIMSSEADLIASATCSDNHEPYRRLVALEAKSSFAFQNRWLADIAPHLLSESMRKDVERAKEIAVLRKMAEENIPKHLLYTAGWPDVVPSKEEADVIASVRKTVSGLLNLNAKYLDAASVRDRYAELMEIKLAKGKGQVSDSLLPQQGEFLFA